MDREGIGKGSGWFLDRLPGDRTIRCRTVLFFLAKGTGRGSGYKQKAEPANDLVSVFRAHISSKGNSFL